MHSLRVENGDLVVAQRRCLTVRGEDKLKQDMYAWLVEAYQVDRFHPQYGSTLSAHVGQRNTSLARFSVQAEVNRVLSNFQRLQARDVAANPMLYAPSEILDRVHRVDVDQYVDVMHVRILFSTLESTGVLDVDLGA